MITALFVSNYLSTRKQSITSRASSPSALALNTFNVAVGNLKDLQKQGKLTETNVNNAKKLAKDLGIGGGCDGKWWGDWVACILGLSASPTPAQGETVAIYWDDQSAAINQKLLQAFIAQSKYTGLSDKDLTDFYNTHNAVDLTTMSDDQKKATLQSGGLVLVGAGSTGGQVVLGNTAVTTYEAGSAAFPAIEMLAPAVELSPFALLGVGSVAALQYTTTQAYADKMALSAVPMPSVAHVLVPKVSGIVATDTTVQLEQFIKQLAALQSGEAMQTDTMSLAAITAAMSSNGLIPALGPQDLKRGLSSGPVSIVWGSLTWFSWCQGDNPNGPMWHVGWRKNEEYDAMGVKVPSCLDFPPLSKRNLLSLIRSFKDRLSQMNISSADMSSTISDIESFAQMLDKYLPFF